MDSQTKLWSLIETIAQTSIGYMLGVISQAILFPIYIPNYVPDIKANFILAGVFTAISFVRGYFIRRLFVWLMRHWKIIHDKAYKFTNVFK